MLQQVARKTAEFVGRDSRMIRTMRPLYESVLDKWNGGGVPWTINGIPVRVDAHNRSRYPRVYDPEVAAILQQRIQPNAVCLDVGANAGIYVLQLAHWSLPHGRVIAFEPNPQVRRVLEHHVVLNGLADRVEIAPCAVGDDARTAVLYAADSDGMSRLGKPNPIVTDRYATVAVDVVTLDHYCESRKIEPDVLLLDIEGFEIAALAGAWRLIERLGKHLSIIVEMHPAAWDSAGTTRSQAESLINSLNRRVVALTGQEDVFRDYGQVELVYAG